jgi:hypothetical protein
LIAYGLHRVVVGANLAIEPLRLLQLVSAGWGALAVAGACASVRAAGAGSVVAIGTALGLGASQAFWEIATDGELYAAAAAALVFAWWALSRVTLAGRGSAAVAGAAAALALLGHQFNAVVAVWGAIWLWRRGCSWRVLVAYGIGFSLVALAGYGPAFWVSGWGHTPYGFFAWLTHYARFGFHFPEVDPIRGAIGGVVASLVPLPGQLAPPPARGWPPLFAAVVFTLAALATLGAMSWRAARSDRDSAGAGVAALMGLTAMALAVWWEPNSRKFWVPALVCAWLAIGVGLRSGRGWQARALLLTVMALTALNYGVAIAPRADPATNPFPRAARAIAAVTAPDDLLIVAPDILGPHLAYHGSRTHVTNLFAVALDANARKLTLRERLDQLIRETAARNGRVFVTADVLTIPPSRRDLVPPLPATVAELFAPRSLHVVLAFRTGETERLLLEAVSSAPAKGS